LVKSIFLEIGFEKESSLLILRKIEGNVEEGLLNMAVIYKQMIKIVVKICRIPSNTLLLPCVRTKYRYSQ
jgi:hypothetical protein